MRFPSAACALVLSMCVASLEVSAQEIPPRVPEIMASGRGEIRVSPTNAVVLFTVENSGRSADLAASDNARSSQETIKSLKSAGVKENEISNGGYSLSQHFENGRPRGFIARNMIRVDIPVANVGKAIDAAVETGATNVSPIQFRAAEVNGPRRDALRMAVQEARRDAEAIAEASGGSLGRLLSMTSYFNPAIMARAASDVVLQGAGGGYTPTDLRPSDLTVIATASGRWEFVPKR